MNSIYATATMGGDIYGESNFFKKIADVASFGEILFIGTCLLVVVSYYLFDKYGFKLNLKKDDKKLEKIKLREAQECLTFDTIDSNMIISEGARYFTSHIDVEGKDFNLLDYADQLNVVNKTKELFTAQRSRLVYRRQNKQIEYGRTHELIDGARERLSEDLSVEEIAIAKMYEERDGLTSEKDEVVRSNKSKILNKKIEEKERRLEAIRYQLQYLDEIEAYTSAVGNMNNGITKETTIGLSYDFRKANFVSGQLTEDEILKKSSDELAANVSSASAILGAGGLSTKRLTTSELENMAYRHWHPITGQLRHKDSLQNTNRDYFHIKDDYSDKLKEVESQELKKSAVVRSLDKLINKAKEREAGA